MKLQYYITAFAMLLSINTFSQTALPYFTGFDNSSQQSGWQHFRKADSSNTNWGYASFNAFSSPNALAHFYPVSGTSATDDWFVSPTFSFSAGGKIDSIRHNFSGFGTPGAGDSIAIFLLSGSADPALASKTLLHDYIINYTNDNVWHKDTGIVIPPTAGLSYIAFKYKTIVNWLDVLLDNLAISGNPSSGTISLQAQNNPFNVYPNPAKDKFIIQSVKDNFDMEIINSFGKVIYVEKSCKSNEQFDCSGFNNGIYFISITDGQHSYHRDIIIER